MRIATAPRRRAIIRPMARGPYNTEDPQVPNRLRYWRKARGLTQEQLAEAADTTKVNIARYESGKRPLTDRLIFRFAEILDIDSGDLLPAEQPLTAEERAWVDRMRAWDPATRATVEAVADAQERFRGKKAG